MGADYYIYTEIKRSDNKWHVLNGKYYNESTGYDEIAETYWNGSRTYFSDTYNKLREIGHCVKSSEISPEVLNKEEWLEDDSGDYVTAVSLSDLRKVIPNTSRRQCCGYVHKSQLWDYEAEGVEIDDHLCAEEYNALSDAEKREYEFYEWDDPMGWYIHLKEIASIVDFQIGEYMRVNHVWDEPSDVRIICIVSY